jgi:soluble P-type ATPase
MIELRFPDGEKINIKHLVLDFNGTIANDGILIAGVKEKMINLSKILNIHIITADTYGTINKQFNDNNINIETIDKDFSGRKYKNNFVESLGKNNVIAIGNGNNDSKMLKSAVIGIAIIGEEGLATDCVLNSDIVFNNIFDALNIIENVKGLIATLRK